MVAVALAYDGISVFLPTITSPVAFLHFLIWFRLHGIKFQKPKQILAGAAGFLFEMFPLTSWFTSWTFVVWYLAWSNREVPKVSQPADNGGQLDKAA